MIFLMEASISMHCALNLEVWKLKQIEWKKKKNSKKTKQKKVQLPSIATS